MDNSNPSVVFETQRLWMGHWYSGLAASALEIYGDPEVTQWIGGQTETCIAGMEGRIAGLVQRNKKLPDCWGSWPAFLKQTNQLVGAMLMKPLPDERGDFTKEIEVGWHLAQAYWGQGYATEGGRKMVELGFAQQNLQQIYAVTGPNNHKSQEVALRLGMKHQGLTDKYYGQTVDLFKITSDEWSAIRVE
ncbi:GNAT family N-acetyltransferase [bacterium]|jgi:[ribosomal protein S5]-alanine N-acetyltransferase|nr:GNAT family N-acetyltransferase [bacterium]MDA7887589.1 GNAT family N-acetyltransferase [bacterium]MDA7926275.1 GNAT family N-acetyltransferase [Mariniblastus sp.]